jgi:pyruvate/2-oxoglutarate/acetoin dehydrogenase E1 component
MSTTVLESLNKGLLSIMDDERVYILGEDILDPYGGAFKVTRGISTKYPSRVLTTPISEAAIVGIANGLAMRGIRPIVEIMFGDFTTLIMDQIVNHAAKFRWMYNDTVRVPIVVRTPMGGRRGYGPTHSQSLEKLFLGIPGIKVVAPNTLLDPGDLLKSAVADNDPVIFVEHKLLYPCRLIEPANNNLTEFTITEYGSTYKNHLLSIPDHSPDLTIATYGYNFEIARSVAIDLLMEFEIFTDIVVFSQLSPFSLDPLLISLKKSHKLLTIEEGTLSLGWGTEISVRAIEKFQDLKIKRIAALETPIANSKTLEDIILPSMKSVMEGAFSLVNS